jgi:hypothetical protein
VSTESIASPSSAVGALESCAACGAPLADDQRYCLECGQRRTPMSSVLLGGPPSGLGTEPALGANTSPATSPAGAGGEGHGNTVTVLAGVGVLLLAMGVGVLIGRAGGSRPAAAPAQVISVASPAAGATAPAATTASFTDNWPSGTNGYTVQLQTLPQTGTLIAAVEAAKTAATGKGAKGVGALKSEDFSSLKAGNYVIYAGVYKKKADAAHALKGLKKAFPSASVIAVSSASSSSEGSGSSAEGAGAGANLNHPAPPSVLKTLKTGGGKNSGQSYAEKSKNLPNVIETG